MLTLVRKFTTADKAYTGREKERAGWKTHLWYNSYGPTIWAVSHHLYNEFLAIIIVKIQQFEYHFTNFSKVFIKEQSTKSTSLIFHKPGTYISCKYKGGLTNDAYQEIACLCWLDHPTTHKNMMNQGKGECDITSGRSRDPDLIR